MEYGGSGSFATRKKERTGLCCFRPNHQGSVQSGSDSFHTAHRYLEAPTIHHTGAACSPQRPIELSLTPWSLNLIDLMAVTARTLMQQLGVV